MDTEIITILGRDINGNDVRDFLTAIQEAPEVTPDEEMGRTYYTFPQSGLALEVDDADEVTTVFLYSEGYEGYRQFRGVMPRSLSWGDSREAVRGRLGQPSLSGDGGEALFSLGISSPFDRYDYHDYSLHVRYADDAGAIQLLTLMTPQATPGRAS